MSGLQVNARPPIVMHDVNPHIETVISQSPRRSLFINLPSGKSCDGATSPTLGPASSAGPVFQPPVRSVRGASLVTAFIPWGMTGRVWPAGFHWQGHPGDGILIRRLT